MKESVTEERSPMLFKDLCRDRHETPHDNYKRISVRQIMGMGKLISCRVLS